MNRWDKTQILREILSTAPVLWIEDFRVLAGEEKYQFLAVYFKLGDLEISSLLLGDPKDWCRQILKTKREEGVRVSNPCVFATKKEFEDYALDHPVLNRYYWDWSEIAKKIKRQGIF